MGNNRVKSLFVYGTLRPEAAPREIAGDVQRLRRISSGSVRGRLLQLGDYPGVVLDSSGGQKISGAVMELPEDAELLARLDAYEEYDPANPESSLFLRQRTKVQMADGTERECWIYTYNRAT